MQIKKHIPNACEGVEPETAEFNNLEELLSIPFVNDFKLHPFEKHLDNIHFKQFSVSDYGYHNLSLLMAEYNKTPEWNTGHWVIGYIDANVSELEKLGLPVWDRQ